MEKFTCVTVNLTDFVQFLKLLHTHYYLMSVLKCLLLCPNVSDVCLLVCSRRNTQMILKHIISEDGWGIVQETTSCILYKTDIKGVHLAKWAGSILFLFFFFARFWRHCERIWKDFPSWLTCDVDSEDGSCFFERFLFTIECDLAPLSLFVKHLRAWINVFLWHIHVVCLVKRYQGVPWTRDTLRWP